MIETIPITSREQWLELRRHDITASDIAAVCGVSPYKTLLQVWAEKTRLAPETIENSAMRRGRWLEDAVIAAVREQQPEWSIAKPGVYLRDAERRMGATPDAVVNGTDILQCKVVARPVFDDGWQDGPPLGYQLQTLAEAMLMGAPRAWLAALVIDTFTADLKLFPVERHDKAERRIKMAVAQFWDDVEAGKMPTADYQRDGELMAALFRPDATREFIDLSGDNLLPVLLEERATISATIKDGEARKDAINAEIVDKLAGAPGARLGGWKVTHTMTHRDEYTVPAKSFPTLRVTRIKEKNSA